MSMVVSASEKQLLQMHKATTLTDKVSEMGSNQPQVIHHGCRETPTQYLTELMVCKPSPLLEKSVPLCHQDHLS